MRTPVSDRFVPTAGESAGLGRYPEYRDSGVEWLGEIPAHWEVRRLKKWLETNARVLPENTDPDYEFDYIDIGSVGTGRLLMSPERIRFESAPSRARRVVRPGDTIVSTVRTYLKAVWHAELPATDLIASTGFAVLSPRAHTFPRFISYLCQSESFTNRVAAESSGVSYPAIAESKLGVLEVSVPSLSEQRGISGFLDRETARIDAHVAKQHELIKLLQEKRTALISHTVTKGLDPDVAMKDSGVEWLGEIPAHWEAKRTKFAATLRSGHTPSRQKAEYWKGCTIPWFGLADVWQIRDGQVEYVQETAEKISEIGLANSAARLLPEGTVILSRTASVGFSAILSVDMATTQDFVNWVCGPFLRPEYLLYVFRAMGSEFQRLTMGSTHQTIYMHDVSSFSTPVPPVSEQDQMVACVREETARIDTMIEKVNEAIEGLNEYRTALISAAVTGKIDVRHHGDHMVSKNTPTTQARP